MKIIEKWNSVSLIIRIVCGLIIGAILGILVPHATGIALLGELFVGALKAIAPILVLVLVASSLASPTPLLRACVSYLRRMGIGYENHAVIRARRLPLDPVGLRQHVHERTEALADTAHHDGTVNERPQVRTFGHL